VIALDSETITTIQGVGFLDSGIRFIAGNIDCEEETAFFCVPSSLIVCNHFNNFQ
jgi:hypothetical protein